MTDPRRTSWTAVDLMDVTIPEPRWAVEGLLPEGLTFFGGAPKLGKSWLGLGTGIAVAAGGHALGQIPVEQGEALYMALEDNARRLQSRLRLLLKGDAAPAGLHLELEWPRLGAGGGEKLIDWLEEHPRTRVVIVDVYPRIRPRSNGRGDHFQDDYDAASALQAIAVSSGVAVVAIYHTRKAEADDFVETLQGTFGVAAAADTIMVVKRTRGAADATLHITGRDVIEQELALEFAPEAGTWALLGDAAEFSLGRTRREILDAVRAHGALTPKQLSELTSVNHELAKKTMQRMFQDGELAAEKGRYSLVTPVPDVPLSLEDAGTGTEGHEGQGVKGESADGLGNASGEDQEPEDAGPGGPDYEDWQRELDAHRATRAA